MNTRHGRTGAPLLLFFCLLLVVPLLRPAAPVVTHALPGDDSPDPVPAMGELAAVGARVEGHNLLDGANVFDRTVDVAALRRRADMVIRKRNPSPDSLCKNTPRGPRLQGVKDRRILGEAVERAAPWKGVKDRPDDNAPGLPGGQQQCLVIAPAWQSNRKW